MQRLVAIGKPIYPRIGIDRLTLDKNRTLIFISTCHVTHYPITQYPRLRTSLYELVNQEILVPTQKNRDHNTLTLEGISELRVVKNHGVFESISPKHTPLPVFRSALETLGENAAILALAAASLETVTITSSEPTVTEEVAYLSEKWDRDTLRIFYIARNLSSAIAAYLNTHKTPPQTLKALIDFCPKALQREYIQIALDLPRGLSELDIMTQMLASKTLGLAHFEAQYLTTENGPQEINRLFDPNGETVFGRINRDLNALRDRRLYDTLFESTRHSNSMTNCVFGSGHGNTLIPWLYDAFVKEGSLISHHHEDHLYNPDLGFRRVLAKGIF